VGINSHRRAGDTDAVNAQHEARPEGPNRRGGETAAGVSRVLRSRGGKVVVVGVAAVVVSSAFVGTAAAVIQEPPPAPLEIVVFPERDFVVTEGGPANQALKFEIRRQGFVIGTASSSQVTPSLLTDADGLLEVNHPGGLCWSGSTPNILPGDKLVVTDEASPTDGFAVTTQNIRATQAEIVGTDVVVHGVALNGDGSPMPLSRVEQRIVQPEFRELPEPLEKRDIRATTDDGNLRRDPAVTGGFIATHSGLTAVQRQKAVDGQTRVLGWQATNAAGDRLGITIYEVGELGGPGFGGCPQGQQGPSAPRLAAAQDSGKKGDHITRRSANLTFAGLAGSDISSASAEPGPGAEVSLLVDGAVRRTGTANANGVYRFAGITLAARTHTVRVRSKDPGAAPTFISPTRRVTVDKAAPKVVLRGARPNPLHLAGPERLHALYRVGEAAQVNAKVQRVLGQRVRTVNTFGLRNPRRAGILEYNWNGRSEIRRNVRPGRYRMLLTVTDLAGNVTTNRFRFRVVR
jgi:hypothetical protein